MSRNDLLHYWWQFTYRDGFGERSSLGSQWVVTWSLRVSIVVAKAYRILGFLRRHCASHGLGPDRKRLLYLTFVRAHLGYASEFWAPQSWISDPKIIESVQRHAARFILNCSSDVDHRHMYRSSLTSLNLLRLSYWFECRDFIFFFSPMHERLI